MAIISRSFLLLTVLIQANHVLSEDYQGAWRNSLEGSSDSCWASNVSECYRVMSIVHGGDWNFQYPYDSFPAMQAGYTNGADAVKGDFRVNGDDVGMVMHSSPIEWYESPECHGDVVENMSTTECEACKMATSNYTFISAPDLLNWAKAVINVMFCIKEESDLPRAIQTLINENATHRSFLEVHSSVIIRAAQNNIPGWEKVYYIVEISNSEEMETFIQESMNTAILSRSLLIEFNDYAKNWNSSALTSDLEKVHNFPSRAVGVTRDDPLTATVENHLEIFEAGFDVVYTYNLANAVIARQQINTENGVSPP